MLEKHLKLNKNAVEKSSDNVNMMQQATYVFYIYKIIYI